MPKQAKFILKRRNINIDLNRENISERSWIISYKILISILLNSSFGKEKKNRNVKKTN